jgi:hypothetical protein
MRFTNPRRYSLKFTAIGCTLLAMGIFGCNQGASTVSTETVREPATQPSTSQATPENIILLKERELVGEELQAFLKTLPKDLKLQPEAAGPSGGLGKSAANPDCIIDFASNKGLWYMPDRAHTNYATSPYYYQPCSPQYAFITPTKYGTYYLVPEASGTCPGAYGMIGYGPFASKDPNVCKNQKDAALFPRYASNASPTYGDMGLTVQMQDAAKNSYLFTANYFLARGGSIMAYGYKPISKSWSTWGPFNQTPGFYGFEKGTNLSVLQFFASDRASVFSVDNISIRGN